MISRVSGILKKKKMNKQNKNSQRNDQQFPEGKGAGADK